KMGALELLDQQVLARLPILLPPGHECSLKASVSTSSSRNPAKETLLHLQKGAQFHAFLLHVHPFNSALFLEQGHHLQEREVGRGRRCIAWCLWLSGPLDEWLDRGLQST